MIFLLLWITIKPLYLQISSVEYSNSQVAEVEYVSSITQRSKILFLSLLSLLLLSLLLFDVQLLVAPLVH